MMEAHTSSARATGPALNSGGGGDHRLHDACAVLHDVHTRATQLLAEVEAHLTHAYGGAVTAVARTPAPPPLLPDSAAADVLLLKCISMQTAMRREATPTVATRLADSLAVLVARLPPDWRPFAAEEQSDGARGGRSTATARETAADASAAHSSASSTAADRHSLTKDDAVAAPCTVKGNSTVAATSPTELVQLALLLRRRWVLLRDLDLVVAALRDVCAVAESGRQTSSTAAATDDPLPAPLLAVAVALASLQLPRTPAELAAHEAREYDARRPSGSMADAPTPCPPPSAVTVLPAWLWRASHTSRSSSGGGGGADGVQAAPPTTHEAAALTAAWASARQATKKIFQWEVRMARYVAAALTAPAASAQGDGADTSLLREVQLELSPERGACNEAQLVWLSTAMDAVAAAGGSLVSPDVARRLHKLEKLLRGLWPTSATARALLPGVLLLGRSCGARTSASRSTSRSDTAAASPLRRAQGWAEALALGRQALGGVHPVVVMTAALLQAADADGTHGERPTLAPLPIAHRIGPVQTSPSAAAAAASCGAVMSSFSSSANSDASLTFRSPLQAQAQIGFLARLPPLPPLSNIACPPTPHQPSHSSTADASRHAPSSTTFPAHTARLPPSPRSLQSAPSFKGGHTAPPLSRSLPLPSTIASASASTAAEPPRRPPPPPSSTLASAKMSSARRSLRHCYRLQNPADAFALRSAVQDATPQVGAKDGGGGGGGAADKSRKASVRRRKESKGASQTSTAALLLSAIIPNTGGVPGSPTAGVDADGNARRRQRRDRNFITAPASPCNTTASSTLMASPAVTGTPSHPAYAPTQESEQPPLDVNCTDGPPLDLGATVQGATVQGDTADGRERSSQRSSSGGVVGGGSNNNNSSSNVGTQGSPFASSPVATAAAAQQQQQQRSSRVARSDGNSGSVGGSGSPHARLVGVNADDVLPDTAAAAGGDSGEADEEDEEEEEAETLPERTARFQREVINFYGALNDRRAHAALTIQLAWRSSKARQALHVRRQALYQYVYTIQKAAALAIDGFLASALLQRRRMAALRTRAAADERRRAREQVEVAAAQRLTRAVRQWLQRQRERRRLCKELSIAHDARLRLYAITAVTVQRWWRRIVVEKTYWRRRTVEVAEQQRRQAEADRRTRAATTLQRRVRGAQTRRRVAQLREQRRAEAVVLRQRRDAATTVLAIVLEEFALRSGRLRREAAAAEEMRCDAAQRIAGGWRSVVERRRLDLAVERARKLRTSATCIQRAWRSYAAGRQRRYLRQLRHTVQAERLAREARTYEVVRLLQCFSRGAQDQLLVRRLRAREGRTFIENLFLLQAVGRGALARAAATRMHAAEQQRQRAAAAALAALQLHAVHTAQALLRARAAAALVQRRQRFIYSERLLVRNTAAREMREDAAATVLQRAVRRRQRRQRAATAATEAAAALEYLAVMAHRVQQTWRAFAARRERRRRADDVARCARTRVEREEVWQLIWQDQLAELDLVCVLERQCIEEEQHAERVHLYHLLRHSPDDVVRSSSGVAGWWGRATAAAARDAAVLEWATIYSE
ncbi:hypothetical protein NESM_000379800 [Novymonas esmeraldas]|uniref:Sfi1 spindle body domain-containing protein n=1 Tax=Novymonas esmeraldas TaxID=1808958 RepID=A0AAW0EP52_9TRYP